MTYHGRFPGRPLAPEPAGPDFRGRPPAPAPAHTPGPWALHEDRSVVFGAGPDRQQVVDCIFSSPNIGREEREANARLIAQAPRMAEILLSAYQHVSHGGPKRGDVEDVLRAAGLIS